MSTTSHVSLSEFKVNVRWLTFSIFIVSGIACLLYSIQFSPQQAAAVLGAAIVVGAASGAIGAFVGFLFGIPKTLQHDTTPESGTTYLANTNLEQISDWLTKILVGIGLVQISQAPDALSHLANRLGPAFGDRSTSPAFALALVLYFFIAGLSVSYIWTKAFLPGILRASDLASQIKDFIQDAAAANAEALILTDRTLAGQSTPSQEELSEALSSATPDCLVTIYQRAEEQRLSHWRDDKKVMAQSIPVFRALAAADTRRQYFRHFGSLGFALKDQEAPDYATAATALTTAIDIRNKRGSRGQGIYEWNRALCMIMLDPAYKAKRRSDSAMQSAVANDLRYAAKQLPDDYFQGGPDEGKAAIKGWMDTNGIDLASLRKEA